MNRIYRTIFLLFLFFSSFAFCDIFANAKNLDSKKLIEKYKSELTDLNIYLSSHPKIVSGFKQSSEDSIGNGNGVVYIDKTQNRLCIDYLSPEMPYKFVFINGKSYHFDKELKEVTLVPQGNNLSLALLNNNITDGTFIFKEINSSVHRLKMKMMVRGKKEDGDIEVVFLKSPWRISSITLENQFTNLKTTITFFDYTDKSNIDSSVFNFS